jgi:peptidoglycan/xylan/chitin deacetylase (PgdA/CDA1 family)
MKLSVLLTMRGIFLPAMLLMFAIEMPFFANANPPPKAPNGYTSPTTDVVMDTKPSVKRQTTSNFVKLGQAIDHCISSDMVAITFDDGPGQNTLDIVNALNSLGVKATFLVNGDNVGNLNTAEDQKILKYVYDSKHLISSHTYSHADLSILNEEGITNEMNNVDRLIKKVIGKRPTIMRPPYGNTSWDMLRVMKQLGYYVVTWNIDTNDWQHPYDTWASIQAFKDQFNASPGSSFISLEHDVNPGTNAQFVREIVQFLRGKGKRMVRLDECLGVPGYRD